MALLTRQKTVITQLGAKHTVISNIQINLVQL